MIALDQERKAMRTCNSLIFITAMALALCMGPGVFAQEKAQNELPDERAPGVRS